MTHRKLDPDQREARRERRAAKREAAEAAREDQRSWRQRCIAAAEKAKKALRKARAERVPDGSRGVDRVPSRIRDVDAMPRTVEAHTVGKRNPEVRLDWTVGTSYAFGMPITGNYRYRRDAGARGKPPKPRARELREERALVRKQLDEERGAFRARRREERAS